MPLRPSSIRILTAALTLTLLPLAPLGAEKAAAFGSGSGGTNDRTRALQQALDEILARTPLHASRTSILVADLDSGQTLFAHDADALLNPASNVKLFTSAAALAQLGPEYRFQTEVLIDAPPSQGAVQTLYVRGKGDPSFVTERLWELASDITERGVRLVKGDLVVDDSFFDDVREGPGYDQERGDKSYLAPAGALSLNWNVVGIHVAPGGRAGERGRVTVEPASDYFEIDNQTKTVKAKARRSVTPRSFPLVNGRQQISVSGRLPVGSHEAVVFRKIDQPALYFGATLKRLLEQQGVRVKGQVRRGEAPATGHRIATSESVPLGEIVRKLDKASNNFMAEQLLKTLGAERDGAPGTWPKGVSAVEDFLEEAGIARGTYVMRNGSGLNDSNRFSARQTVMLLREMWRRFPIMPDFLAALPIAGRDGTTRSRMGATQGRLRAKTGTLENVSSLSGYVETTGRQRLVFSILVNDFPGRLHPIVRAVDAIGTTLAAAGGTASALGAAVASAFPPPAPRDEPIAELRAQLTTYYRLARDGDPRNVTFLRTALATEEDPALRMAAAEALFLSEPDAESAQRAFLDTLAADAASFGRLQRIGAGFDDPPPVLDSLADLASQGNIDALSRLIELMPTAVADATDAPLLIELWEDVARDVPDLLVRVLRREPAPAVTATLPLIARAIAKAEEPDHPLPHALARASGDPDAALAAFAKALRPRLDEQLAAARALRKMGTPTTIGPPGAAATPAFIEGRGAHGGDQLN